MARTVSALLLSLAVVRADEDVVTTPLGDVQGLVLPGYRVFQGVPYGIPPVGPRRWTHSEQVLPWAPKVWNATVEAPGCPQVCVDNEPPHICPTVVSEDCLYMNIYTPRLINMTKGPPPVLLFLHGGNFKDGYTGGMNTEGGLLYDGQSFVENTGQIVVVINYRLGSFGFLYLGGVLGNFGLEDQITATTWVKNNIAAFGGDPSRITLFGQSAGAMSISCHMTRPQTAGLFVGAAMISNPLGEPYRSVSSALSLATVYANYSGCPVKGTDWNSTEACLRTKDMATLIEAQHLAEGDIIADLEHLLQVVVVWSPTIGTAYLPLRPMEAFQQGQVLDIPYIIGTTANETVIFLYEALDFPLTIDLYNIIGPILVGPEAFNESHALYPYPDPMPSDLRLFASTLLTDGLFLCPTRNTSEALYAAQPFRRSPVFVYQYSHIMSWANQMWGANFTECDTEVCHGSDLPAWWHPEVTPGPGFGNYTLAEDAMSNAFQWYFANFAATGKPGTANPASPSVAWPAYSAATRQTLNIETSDMGGITVLSSVRAKFCDWWDARVGYNIY